MVSVDVRSTVAKSPLSVFEQAIQLVEDRLCPVEVVPDEDTLAMEDDLELYLQGIWHVIEPETPYVGGFHIGAIARHLEAVFRRQIRNLLVTIPPRMTKSVLMSVAFPTWAWAKDPGLRFLTASYSSSLSCRTRGPVAARHRLVRSIAALGTQVPTDDGSERQVALREHEARVSDRDVGRRHGDGSRRRHQHPGRSRTT
jgi:hypothetical protein